MIRQDFQHIALVRLEDAQALLDKNQYDGCCYIAGYCIELAHDGLKMTRVEVWPGDMNGYSPWRSVQNGIKIIPKRAF